MIPGQAPHAPMAPHSAAPGPSPLAAMLQRHAMGAPPMGHPGGMQPQAAGAPMQLGAGGHAAPKFGHAPTVMPGC